MRLGISSYTYGWAVGTEGDRLANSMTAIDLIDRAAALGVGVVQIADNLPADSFTRDAVAAIKRHADARDVSLELGTRGCGVEHLMRFIGLAHQVGSPVLRIVLDTQDDHPCERVAVERLRACAHAATSLGVTLAVENHDRFDAAILRRIVDAIGPAAGICLDTVNSMGALEGPKLVVETLGPVVVNLHLKDFQVRRVPSMQGFVIEGCPAGEGMLNIQWLLERLRAFGRDCNAILEQWAPPEASIAQTIEKEARWAAQGVGTLRELIPD